MLLSSPSCDLELLKDEMRRILCVRVSRYMRARSAELLEPTFNVLSVEYKRDAAVDADACRRGCGTMT